VALAWSELERVLEQRYRIVRRTPSWLVVQWRTELAVRVEVMQMFEQEWLLVAADVGPAHSIHSDELLARNLRLAFGAYAFDDDRIVVRATDALATTSPDKVIAAIEALARESSARRSAHAAVVGLYDHLVSD
jgi:hypothetical protein